jgi:hypothetical protein
MSLLGVTAGPPGRRVAACNPTEPPPQGAPRLGAVTPPRPRARDALLFGKSRRTRAYPQQVAATRPLHYLQDPDAHQSRLLGIRTRAAEIAIRQAPPPHLRGGGDPARWGARPEAYSRTSARAGASPRSGTDSDLEAFSHYPADGSFAALPGRTAAKTNYLNQRFLSY